MTDSFVNRAYYGTLERMKKYRILRWIGEKWNIPRFVVIIGSLFAAIGLVFTLVFFGMQFGVFNVKGSSASRNASLGTVPKSVMTSTCLPLSTGTPKACDWDKTQEWAVLNSALQKDSSTLDQVSNQTGVPARIIVSAVVPEQLRYFTSNRESFKKYFEPLEILSSLTKFSLGVSGIKQDTATQIEQYANDPTSPFYPGPEIAPLIAYPAGVDHDTELYNRLTAKDHYYSYLYTAIFLKEIEAQWSKSGFDVSQRPDVLVTLFNIGFGASHPNANPQVAGSVITIGGHDYSFGELGVMFYQSNDLLDVFPR
ncbi:MAG TPA: hypothetical protein VL576_03415 [Candidatus Paceibacterota bacterium]|jgi:hypothetical protein|nr:hypothetical protein [Candidatus Paceibacterota bacterium]